MGGADDHILHQRPHLLCRLPRQPPILSAAPALKGVLVDLPSVIDQSEPLWAKIYPGLLGRVSFVRGSFFDAATVPKNTGQGRHCYTSKVSLALRCKRC